LYEGYTAEQVTRAVRLFAALGAKALVLTNAAGGISSRMTPGSLMLVEDQVSLQWRSPLRGDPPLLRDPQAVEPPTGPRGIDSRPLYSAELLGKAARAASLAGVRAERGVLGVMLGPSYETPAEIAMLERMGADAVCMSTAAETALASTIGLPVAGISCITNWAAGRSPHRLSHADVTAAVAAQAAGLRSLLERLILALA
jgi:purine-nucleoside phosphorylase